MKPKSQRDKEASNPSLMVKPEESAETKRNKGVLRLFFVMRDRKFIPYVDDLFRLFSLPQIAHGLFLKYKLIPYEYKEELETLTESGFPHTDWFNELSDRVTWLDEKCSEFPPVTYYTVTPKRDLNSDKVIDEMINNERIYYDRLDFICHTYAGELQAISQNKLGPEAMESLGLNINDIEFIFGSKLQKVIEIVEILHLRLELLHLVKYEPISSGGRVGAVADLFLELAEEIEMGYGPYNSRYATARKLVDTKIRRAYAQQKPVTTVTQMKFLNFDEIWKETTPSKEMLRNKTLDNILGSPIKHFTDYQVFLKTLASEAKKENKDEETLEKINRSCVRIAKVLQDVDAYVQSQEETENKILKGLMKK